MTIIVLNSVVKPFN